jgi:hypothetical protein
MEADRDSPMSTPIADMIARMLAAGVAHDVILAELRAAEIQLRTLPAKPEQIARTRGSRLWATWQPSQTDIDYALAHGMTRQQIAIEAEKFRNYWTAKSGQGATKADWGATWRNWCLKAAEEGNGRPHKYRSRWDRTDSTARSAVSGADAILAGLGRLAHRIVERRNATGPRNAEMSNCANVTGKFNFDESPT